MNAHALQPDLGLVLANARLYERLAESALDRRRANDRPSFGDRFMQLIARVRSAITQPAPTAIGFLPALTDYPYAR